MWINIFEYFFPIIPILNNEYYSLGEDNDRKKVYLKHGGLSGLNYSINHYFVLDIDILQNHYFIIKHW